MKQTVQNEGASRGAHMIAIVIGDYECGWPTELWHSKSDASTPMSWKPRHQIVRQQIVMETMVTLGLEPPI